MPVFLARLLSLDIFLDEIMEATAAQSYLMADAMLKEREIEG